MKVLELFFGTGSFSRSCLNYDVEITGVDIEPCPVDLKRKISFYQKDILNYFPKKWFDVVWASVPCATFSRLPRVKYRENCKAIMDKSRLHDSYLKHTIDIIEHLNPYAAVIENPVGCMREQDIIKKFDCHTVSYCQYGDLRMKPTDLFFYPLKPERFVPRRCKHTGICSTVFEDEGRTGHTDTTIKTPSKDRSKVPTGLCDELAMIFFQDFTNKKQQQEQSRLENFFDIHKER